MAGRFLGACWRPEIPRRNTAHSAGGLVRWWDLYDSATPFSLAKSPTLGAQSQAFRQVRRTVLDVFASWTTR